MVFDIEQDFENSNDQTNMLMAGVGEGGCQTVATIVRDFVIPGLRPVLADKQVALSRFRLSHASRIDLDVEWREDYKRCLEGVRYVFILVKLSGEYEINAVKIMAKVTADMNIPFVVFARMPSERFTGAMELKAAENALETLRELANASVVIPDDTLFQTIPGDLPVKMAYERATRWFAEAVAGVARPFASENVSDTNASHLEWLVKRKNATCSVGFGWGSGLDAADEAIERLRQSPFLKHATDAFAVDAALVILSAAPRVTSDQTHQALRQVKSIFDETIHLESCICVDNSLEEDIRITALLRATEQAEPVEPADSKPDAEAAKQIVEPSRRRTGRKSKGAENQMMLVFREEDLGIFSAKEPTKYCGENLDLPTYSRLNL